MDGSFGSCSTRNWEVYMANPEKLSDETTLPNPDADKQPQHVIEYATPALINPDEKAALVLGLLAVTLPHDHQLTAAHPC
jgi:hypothetical protein